MEPIIRRPNGYHAAVTLAFDVDAPTGAAMLDDALPHYLRSFSQGRYGLYCRERGLA
jgi:hypothetical protein